MEAKLYLKTVLCTPGIFCGKRVLNIIWSIFVAPCNFVNLFSLASLFNTIQEI